MTLSSAAKKGFLLSKGRSSTVVPDWCTAVSYTHLTHADVTLPLSLSELREAADGQLSMFGVGRPSVMDQLAANRPTDKKSDVYKRQIIIHHGYAHEYGLGSLGCGQSYIGRCHRDSVTGWRLM